MSAQHCLVFVLGFNLGESTVKEVNRSFDRSRSKFADPRFRPRGRITKSVTLTTAYNRTILSGTAASAQNKMAKAALHLKKQWKREASEFFFWNFRQPPYIRHIHSSDRERMWLEAYCHVRDSTKFPSILDDVIGLAASHSSKDPPSRIVA